MAAERSRLQGGSKVLQQLQFACHASAGARGRHDAPYPRRGPQVVQVAQLLLQLGRIITLCVRLCIGEELRLVAPPEDLRVERALIHPEALPGVVRERLKWPMRGAPALECWPTEQLRCCSSH